MQGGQPSTGLDHLYTNKPEKLSTVQTHFTGMSDHKLLKVTRFSKSFKQCPRFIRKRMMKNFDGKDFRSRLQNSNLDEILTCSDANEATELLVGKLSTILDEIAPIKTVQTRTNYAPWLEKDTKKLQQLRNDAQSQAAQSKDPEDWRLYTNLRNQSTAKGRADKKAWEEKKLDHNKNSTTDMWTTVKGWLDWG